MITKMPTSARAYAEKILYGSPLGTTLAEAYEICMEQIELAQKEAYEKGFAEGFAEAREQAAKVVQTWIDKDCVGENPAKRIRSLLPKGQTETDDKSLALNPGGEK